jgi:F-type H+-transporting ATPase subunit epsilon
MSVIKLSILTPQKEFYSSMVKSLSTESLEGHVEVLPGHIPMIALLKPSVTELTDADGKKLKAFTSSGVLRVDEDGLILLTDAAEWPGDIDKERARKAKERSEERLKQVKGVDMDRAQLALLRALTRLKMAE